MSQAFYRQYRPKKLSEVVGQEHITDTLSNALKQGKISHAYLFTGPRGVGKTSIARILAHEVNKLPYDDESTHLDIIEIDAASNRRIDEIRDIRDKVHISPTSAPYKVYIIDEVHMLTKEAFNALLKTLEEPPKHVIFILATTEVHKLPETIISRTQRYSFRPVDFDKVTAHLRSIADKEKITIDDDALRIIAEHGEGSFRDSISLLDQAAGLKGTITLDTVRELLGTPSKEVIMQIIASLQSGDSAQLLRLVEGLKDHGLSAGAIAKEILKSLRSSMLDGKPLLDPVRYTALSKQLIEVSASMHPYAALEIALIEALPTTAQALHTIDPVIEKNETPSKPIKEEVKPKLTIQEKPVVEEKPVATETSKVETPKEETPKEAVKPKLKKPSESSDAFSDEQWSMLLQAVKKSHNTLYTVLRIASPSTDGDKFIISCSFPFHQKQLSIPKNRKVISDVIQDITGVGYELIIEVNKDKATGKVPPKTSASPTAPPSLPSEPQDAAGGSIDTIKDIFGGGEILS